ncbi:hypothetical protein LTR17_008242 [Elasticomyces elasticus]|nr:hypothetical protein LTR17_008242 [Elasticomyces elasticus]
MRHFWSAVDDERLDHLQEVLWFDEAKLAWERYWQNSLSSWNDEDYKIARDAELSSIWAEMVKQVVGMPVQKEWEDAQEKDRDAPSSTASKIKPKTRPIPGVADLETAVGALLLEHPAPPHTIAVSSGNLRLLERMCVLGSASREGSFVKFEAFVGALVDGGCTVQQHSGSAVTFRLGNRTVVVHRPHPDSKISPIMLKAIGKRVTKHFGWDDTTFTERAK